MCVHEHLVGNRTISEIESNQSGNCVIARVLPAGRASKRGKERERKIAPTGTFLRARIHTPGRVTPTRRSIDGASSCPRLMLIVAVALIRRLAIHPVGTGAGILVCIRSMSTDRTRLAFYPEITHSRPKRCSGTTPAVHPRGCVL